MASLSNINGLFDVHSTGAILFSTSHGTSGQILKSNGNAAPTWVDASTVIGGPYLPLSGGTLTGATATASGISFTVGGALSAGVTTITSDTGLRVYSSTNAVGANITFSDVTNRTQKGFIKYFHADTASYGSANAFVITSDQSTITVLADGKLMYNEGIYLKPATGTGGGSRKDNLWDAAYNDKITALAVTGTTTKTLTATQQDGGTLTATWTDNDGGGTVTGTGANTQVAFWTGTSVIDGSSDLRWDNTNKELGIGRNPDYPLDVYKSSSTSGTATGTTVQRLWNYVGADLSQQKTFIDFVFQDDNDNQYPQVRIGAEVGQNGDANSTIKEGSGAFVVYTNNANGSTPGTNVLAERMRVDYAGNVGIGTTSPVYKLTIGGNSVGSTEGLRINDPSNAAYGGHFSFSDTPNEVWIGGITNNVYNSAIGIHREATRALTIDTNNNVGIGTASPAFRLEVISPTTNVVSRFTSQDNQAWISVRDDGYTTYGAMLGCDHDAGLEVILANNAATKRLVINNSGNVGIGTTSPDTLLHISKNSSNSQLTLERTGTATGNFKIYTNTNSLFIYDEGQTSHRMMINSSGNVGIGTTSPGYKLTVAGEIALDSYLRHNGDSNTFFGFSGNDEIKFRTAGSDRIFINSSGNVGIGTTSPIAKLDVNGSVQGTSFYNLANPSPIMFPEGGTFNGSSSHTGNIVIKLPDTGGVGVNNMMTCLVRIFDYATSESFDVRFNGYFYGSNFLWTRTAVWIDSSANIDRNFTVRFGKELGGSGTQDRAVVTIGEGNSTWSYPKVAVIQYTPGHSEGAQPQIWNSGWNVSVVADYWDGTDNTLDDTITNNQVNNWRRSGQNLYYGSGTGNVGIGTTSPNHKLQVEGGSSESIINLTTTGYANGLDIIEGTDGHAAVWLRENSYMHFGTNSLERMRITSGGNIGIGTTSPGYKLDVAGTVRVQSRLDVGSTTWTDYANNPIGKLNVETTGDNAINIYNTNEGYAYLKFIDSQSNGSQYSRIGWSSGSGNPFVINNMGVDAITINNSGHVGINNTSPQTTLHTGPTTTITNVFTARFAASNFFASGGNSMFYVPDTAANIMMFGSNQFGTNQIEFYHKNPGTSQAYVGRISTSGSATSYVTSSDYRLKENIIPISDSISRLNQLKPSRFNFIEEPGKMVDGFIAHEVQDIVPEAIVGEKDEVDEEGGIIPQGIDQAKLVPLLVAAVQELEARVKELENK